MEGRLWAGEGVTTRRRSAPSLALERRFATGGMVIVTRQDNPGGPVVFHVDAG